MPALRPHRQRRYWWPATVTEEPGMTTRTDPLTRALRQIAVAPRLERMAALFGADDAMTRIEG